MTIKISPWQAHLRHAHHYIQIAEQAQRQYLSDGADVASGLALFDRERPNLDLARTWAQLHVGTSEGDQLLVEAVRVTRDIGHVRYDRQHESIPLWEGVRAAAQRLSNRTEEAHALRYLGIAYARLGKLYSAITYFEQALAIFREPGDQHGKGRGESQTLGNLGLAYQRLGELPKAITFYEQALTIARERGDHHGEGLALGNLGGAYADLGEPSKAIRYYQQRLAIARELGDRHSEGKTLNNLGNTYTDLGIIRQAIDMCMAALTITRAIGDRLREGYALSYLARAQAIQGDIMQAITTFAQALALLREVGDHWGAAEGQWLVGLALIQQGEREHALPLLCAALAYWQETGYTKLAQYKRVLARLEAGEGLPPELCIPAIQQAIGDDLDRLSSHDERV